MKLNDGELLARAKKVGEVSDALLTHVMAADLARKKLKAEELKLEEERARLERILHTGHEQRETPVEAWADFSTGMMEVIRTDTKQLLEKRPLEAHERQGEFDLDLWREDLHKRIKKQQMEELDAAHRRRAGDDTDDEESYGASA